MSDSRTQLASTVADKIVNNSTGSITAADVRAALLAIVNACFNLESDRVELANLSSAVLATLQSGLDPTKYQGTWTPSTNTPTIAAAAGPNAGQWYIAATAGTASGNAAGTYVAGDRIQSNGTAWLKQPAPPVTVAPGSVTWEQLAPALQSLMYPQDSSEYVYAIVDSANRVAFGVKPTGELFGKFAPPDASVTTPKLAPAAVTLPSLATEVSEVIGAVTAPGSGYSWAVIDSAGRIGLAINEAGEVVGKFKLNDASVVRAKLAPDVALPESIEPSSGFHYAIVDAAGRVALGITELGHIFGTFVLGANSVSIAAITDKAVTQAKLSDQLARNVPQGGGRFEVADDGGWRGRTIDVPGRTSTVGTMFAEFAPMAVRSIRGINATGTTLQFRRSAGLTMRGIKYRGTWDAATGSPDAAPLAGDWWNCTSPGTFFGITWASGDRLVALDTVVSQGAQWVKGLPGEFFFLGEFNPAAHTPSNIRNGDIWQASTAGTFSSLTFADGDLLVREQATWGKITSAAWVSVANGAFFHFDTVNAREIEVRRADKGTTRVGILAQGLRTLKTCRSTDAVVMLGDSMVATGGLSAAITGLLAGRTFTGISYPGASSDQILAMMRKELRGADTYRGRLHAFFAGTNNANDLAQTREAALWMAEAAGARDNRVVFLSPIGQHQNGWNGSRITLTQFEDSFANSGVVYNLEQWFANAFPGCFVNCRAELLARAPSTPHLQFPGLTEAQAAATYGAVPLSFFLDYGSKPWTPAGLSFQGYHSAAGLPSGGSDGHYWVRTANGTIGAILVRWAGTWSEHTFDITHMNTVGNAALADAFVDFLVANNI